MRVVCNSPELYVVDYPGIDAVEVIDKRVGRGGLMRNEAAQRFRAELEVWSEASDPETFDDFINPFGALMTQQAIYH